MKKILFLLFIPLISFGATYQVATDGSGDFTTIAQVNAFTFAENDIIQFRKGDAWGEGLVITEKVRIEAYGSGDNPIIYGRSTVTGFTSMGGNKYYKVLTNDDVHLFLFDGDKYMKGHYPEDFTGYTTASTSASVTADYASGNDYTGFELSVKENNWTICVGEISGHVGSTMTFDNVVGVTPRTGTDYWSFVQNHPSLLNSNGDWAYRNDTLYVYSSDAITNHTIQVSSIDIAIDVQHADVTIDGIGIDGIDEISIKSGDAGLTVDNCTIKYVGGSGIAMPYNTTKSNFTASNNVIKHCQDGIFSRYSSGDTGFQANGNVIDSIGLYAGLGVYFDSQNNPKFCGIRAEDYNYDVHIYENTVTHIGYNGIHVQKADSLLIHHNFVDLTNSLLGDGGCIYSYRSHIYASDSTYKYAQAEIYSNIVSGATLANAIYQDGFTNSYHIYDNTVIGTEFGIYCNNPRLHYIHDNTSYGCDFGVSLHELNSVGVEPYGNLISNNVVYGESSSDILTYIYSDNISSAVLDFGVMDTNIYLSDAITGDLFRTRYNPPYVQTDYTFTEWQALNLDANSSITQVTPQIRYNATMIPVTAFADSTGTTVDGVFSDGVTLGAFESVVTWDVSANPTSPSTTVAAYLINGERKALQKGGVVFPIK